MPSFGDSMPMLTRADPAMLRDVLLIDTGCPVAVVDPQGRVTECNDAFTRFSAGTPDAPGDETAIAVSMGGITNRTHVRAVRRALTDHEPVIVEGVRGGCFFRATYREFNGAASESENDTHVLLVLALASHDALAPPNQELAAKLVDLLARLTPRELVVLHHIGMGLSAAEIADTLNRSIKTIEGHRVSLGVKLGVSNRVHLARLAIGSGLSPLSMDRPEPKGDGPA